MKVISSLTRKRMSIAAKARCDDTWRKNMSEKYRAKIDDSRLAQLYESGHSQSECAMKLGVSQKVVFNAMIRLGIPRRRAIKRNQHGSLNAYWKGDNAGYQAFHRRVEAANGKPKKCAVCGNTDSRYYDWANLTGNYSQLTDYKRMCRSCHRRYDASRRGVVMPNA